MIETMRWAWVALAIPLSAGASAQEQPGFYIGGNFGATRFDSGNFGDEVRGDLLALGFSSVSVNTDESDTGFRLFAGYQITPNVAVEAFYANLGRYSFTVDTTGPTVRGRGEFDVTGFGLDVLGMLPISRTFSGFARVGFVRWEMEGDFTATGPGGTTRETLDDDGNDLKLGLGVQWALAPNVRLRGEVEYYAFEDKLFMFSVGALFKF